MRPFGPERFYRKRHVHIVITYFLSFMALFVVTLIVSEDLIRTYSGITIAVDVNQKRLENVVDTNITGPIGLSVSQASDVEMTLVNAGGTAIAEFADWTVIFEVQKASGFDVEYLTYTTSASPSAGEWTVKGIYFDAATLTAEVIDPGTFNPGEEMIVRANPTTALVANTYDRATFATPNGVGAKVIFKVVP